MTNKPLLITICNDKWVTTHLPRWIRYARKYSGCRLGLILISDNPVLAETLREQFDELSHYSAVFDKREFYNEIRLEAPVIFGESVIYCDCDADVWGDLSHLLDPKPTAELLCVSSPGHFPDWERMGRTEREFNNGFLVLNYSSERATEVVEAYRKRQKEADEANAQARVSGSIGFNLMLHGGDVKWAELPYDYSVIWWDSMRLRNAKVIQWCNDRGQAKRLLLEQEFVNGGDLL